MKKKAMFVVRTLPTRTIRKPAQRYLCIARFIRSECGWMFGIGEMVFQHNTHKVIEWTGVLIRG